MPVKNDEIKRLITRFIQEIKNDIRINKIILFGSYATGKIKQSSDIDLIVVSKDFEKKDEIEAIQYLFRKASRISSLIEPIPASYSEVKNADKRDFMGQVIKYGKVIYSQGRFLI
ncbi:MAG: nucleotidyltransferase domain-containing protein [Elusimicrobiota bacterium]